MKVHTLVKLILLIIKLTRIFAKQNVDLLIYTFATLETDGYLRLLRSARMSNLVIQEPLGMETNFSSTTVKISQLKMKLEEYKDRSDVIIMFIDSYDGMFTAGKEEILTSFFALNSSIVFGAETNCYPIKNLTSRYPEVQYGYRGYRFLNSGAFIGYAPDVYDMLQIPIISQDDQLHYTLLYLDEGVRKWLGMTLDTQATIFQNLHNAVDHVSFIFLDHDTKLYNNLTKTMPSFIHGNGNSKQNLHRFSNYLAKSWTVKDGCLSCYENLVNLNAQSEKTYPSVFLGFFIERPTPFLEEKLSQISKLKYPKKRVFLFVFNMIDEHKSIVGSWFSEHNSEYSSAKLIQPSKLNGAIRKIRLQAINLCKNLTFDYYFSIDSEVYIENQNTLTLLVSYNRTMIAPLMTEPGSSRSTFWGEITDDLKYIESFDYQHIINGTRKGIWNIAQVSHIYLIGNNFLSHIDWDGAFDIYTMHPDVIISTLLRMILQYSMFIYVTNLDYYGHLSNMENIPIDNLYSDLWHLETNSVGWEKKYLHPLFNKKREFSNSTMVCPDVYLFPLFTSRFCQEMISVVKNNGKWSVGSNVDRRLNSGYEFIPAFDMHLNQIEYNKEWAFIIKKYIKSIAEFYYSGYHSKGASQEDFVVRQDTNRSLLTKPHHDSSTYTVNVALNDYLTDYQGGGTLFLRYNCSVDYMPIGWAMIYPGRLTHSHESKIVTNGTKYTLVSFIDSYSKTI